MHHRSMSIFATLMVWLAAVPAYADATPLDLPTPPAICSCFELLSGGLDSSTLITDVPEPAGLAVLGIGMAGLAAIRSRHPKQEA